MIIVLMLAGILSGALALLVSAILFDLGLLAGLAIYSVAGITGSVVAIGGVAGRRRGGGAAHGRSVAGQSFR